MDLKHKRAVSHGFGNLSQQFLSRERMSSVLAKLSSPGRFAAGKKNTQLTLGLELHQTQVSGRKQGARQRGWSWTETEGHACWKNLKLRRTVSSGSQDGSYNSSRKTLELLGQVHLANIITSERFPFCYLSCFLSFFLFFFEKGQCLSGTSFFLLCLSSFTHSQVVRTLSSG